MVVQVAEETSKNQTILYEQIKVLLESAYFILITYAITAAAFLFVMWDVVSHTILINWGVVFLLVLLIRDKLLINVTIPRLVIFLVIRYVCNFI